MNKKIFLALIVFFASNAVSYSQKVIFTEDFVSPQKWKTSNSANGSMSIEKEGTESIMKIEALEGKEFQASIKVPALTSTAKSVWIEFDFFLNDIYNSQVIVGESPNRLWVIAEKNNTLRLAGEAIQMADGAKFLNASPNRWYKMLIKYDIQSKLATFTLDGKDSKVVDLNMQPNKSYQFTASALTFKSLKGGSLKVKAIKISEF